MRIWNRELLRWMLFTGIAYPILCAVSVIMAFSAGIMPERGDPPAPWHIKLISSVGGGLANVLMRPFLPILKLLPGRSIPAFDYVWLFILGMLIGALGYYLKRFVKNKYKES